MHASDAITDHPHLVRIWKTRDLRPGDDIRGIGAERGGRLVTYHLTDDPAKVLAAIKKRGDLLAAYGARGETAELGAGLYASGVPEFWSARSHKKWDFLDDLEAENQAGNAQRLEALVEKLAKDVDRDLERGRLTQAEHASAMKRMGYVVTEGSYDANSLIFLANPPYSIAFWKPEYLEPLGIAPGPKPQIVELELQGDFAEVDRVRPDAQLLRTLRRAGVAGAFTRMGMGTNPELVIWDVRAIKSATLAPIAAYEAREARESSRPRAEASEAREGRSSMICMGRHVAFKLHEQRELIIASERAGMLFDSKGVDWPNNSLLVMTFHQGTREPERESAGARAYFGRNATILEGEGELPERALSAWREVGAVDIVYYRRAGTRAPGDYKHKFHAPKGLLRIVFALKSASKKPAILYRLASSRGTYRLELPKGCIIDDRGIVLP